MSRIETHDPISFKEGQRNDWQTGVPSWRKWYDVLEGEAGGWGGVPQARGPRGHRPRRHRARCRHRAVRREADGSQTEGDLFLDLYRRRRDRFAECGCPPLEETVSEARVLGPQPWWVRWWSRKAPRSPITSVAKMMGVSLRRGKEITMVQAHVTTKDLELLTGKLRPARCVRRSTGAIRSPKSPRLSPTTRPRQGQGCRAGSVREISRRPPFGSSQLLTLHTWTTSK